MQETRKVPRLLIGAVGSGSGKTTLTCALLKALMNRGKHPVSFKCGPDYIDPMFHTEVVGVPGRNLDLFFSDEATVNTLLHKHSCNADIAILEGVMGYYDGLGGSSSEASSWDLARKTNTPGILLVDAQGKSCSILAEIKGFLDFQEDSRIRGVILNRVSLGMYPDLKAMIEETLGVAVYGFLPEMEDCSLKSRHLGLVTAKEIENLQEILQILGAQAEKSVNLDGLLTLANQVESISFEPATCAPQPKIDGKAVRIGVAMDQAFCFYYADNLDFLREQGANIVPFSPLFDQELPGNLQGLILGGGYPELYLKQLSANEKMKEEIRKAIETGMPCIAECGGFMYLHKWIQDREGKSFAMVGTLEGTCFPTETLRRFGYITLTAREDTLLCKKGESLRGHEFHYWDSACLGEAFLAKKPLGSRTWEAIISRGNLFAGFPHLFLYGNGSAAEGFLEKCRQGN